MQPMQVSPPTAIPPPLHEHHVDAITSPLLVSELLERIAASHHFLEEKKKKTVVPGKCQDPRGFLVPASIRE